MRKDIFIGRKDELAVLNSMFQESSTGLGKIVLIKGIAGIGKSGLVREFINTIEPDSKYLSAISECNDKEGINAYAPFKDLLLKLNTAALEVNSDEKKTATLNKLKQFVSEAGVHWISFIPMVGGIASAGIETYKAFQNTYGKKSLTEIESEKDVYRIIETELRRLSENKTLIIFLDDLQWADSSSLNLLFALSKNIRENPFKIMVIASYRPEEIECGRNKISENGENTTITHPLVDKVLEMKNYTKQEIHITRTDKWFTEIELRQISRLESDVLISEKFTPNNFSKLFFDTIYSLSQGHLLYINEILNYLSENNTVKCTINGDFQVDESDFEHIPISIQAIIEEKIQRLNDDLKKVLSYASVSGTEFEVQLIEKILNIDELQLLDYLEILNKKHGLIVAETPKRVNEMLVELYRFSQSLIQKHVYQSIDAARRRALHRKMAEMMKIVYSTQIETDKNLREQYILHCQIGQGLIDGVSRKLEMKEQSENEEEYTNAAQDSALDELKKVDELRRQFALDEALILVDKALAFISDNKSPGALSAKLTAYFYKSKIYQQKGLYQKALETAQYFLKISQDIKDNLNIANAYVCIGESSQSLGNYENAVVFFKHACNLFIDLENYELLIDSYNKVGSVKESQSLYDEAIEYYDKALEINKILNNNHLKAETFMLKADAFRKKGFYDNAQKSYSDAMLIFEKLGDKRYVGLCINKLGLTVQNKGEYDKAIRFFFQALEIAKSQNDIVNIANRINNIGLSYELKGDYPKAIEYYEQSLAIDKSLNDRPKMAISFNNIGSAYSSSGEIEKSYSYFNQAMDIYRSINDLPGISFTSSNIANSLYYEGKNEDARKYYKQALDIDIQSDDKLNYASNLTGIANTYYSQGDNQTAHEYYLKSAEYFRTIGDLLNLALVTMNIANIEYSIEKYDEALKKYLEVLNFHRSTDDKVNISLLLGNIGNLYTQTEDLNKAENAFQEAIQIDILTNNNKHKAQNLKNLSYVYYLRNQNEDSLKYIRQAIDIYKEKNEPEILADCYKKSADNYFDIRNYKTALSEYKLSQEIYENLDDKNNSAILCQNIGNTLYNLQEYEDAKDYYKKSRKNYAAAGENEWASSLLLDIAGCYEQLQNTEKAFEKYTKAEKENRKYGLYNNTASALKNLGFILVENEQFEDALHMFNDALELYETEVNSPDEQGICLCQIGDLHTILETPNADKNIIPKYQKALELFIRTENESAQAITYFSLGLTYKSEKKYWESIENFRKSQELNIKLEEDTHEVDKEIKELESFLRK